MLGTSFQELSPSPIPPTSNEMTHGFGKLNIDIDSTVRTARKCDKRGRPRKEVTAQETKRRQMQANNRERKRMSELTKMFNDLRKILPTKDHIKSKKEVLVMVKMKNINI